MLYHVALTSEWGKALTTGCYDRGSRHEPIGDVGFIHTSDSYEQTARVVRYRFDGVHEPVTLLSISVDALAATGLWVVNEPAHPDDPSSEKFPHIYGGPLPVSAVSRVREFESPENLLSVLDEGEDVI